MLICHKAPKLTNQPTNYSNSILVVSPTKAASSKPNFPYIDVEALLF